MPLQLRRGTDAQRSGVVFAAGELIYVTDTEALYVGDGSTAGGVAVANLSASDIRSISAGVLTGGSHTGISFTFDGTNIDAVVDPDLSNYQGVIRASAFNGTLVDDSSTILVDAVSSKINLDGTVKGNIIPDADSAYDIGSSSFKFRDLYLSGSTLYLGTAQVTAVGSAVNLPSGSTIAGVPIGTGSGTGDGVVEGNTYKISIAAEDSSLMLNALTETITASGGFFGNLTGNVTGNVSGSVTGNLAGNAAGSHTGTFKGDILASDNSTVFAAGTKTFTGNLTGNVTGNAAGSHTGTFKGDVLASDNSTVFTAGTKTFTGNLTGNVTGNAAGSHTGTFKGDILASDNSTAFTAGTKTFTGNLTGNVTGNLTGNVNGNLIGNTSGFHTGDVKGSLFADDSTRIIDSTNGSIFITNGSLTLERSIISSSQPSAGFDPTLGTAIPVVVVGERTDAHTLFVQGASTPMVIRGAADGTNGTTVDIQSTRLSGDSLSTIQDEDYLAQLAFSAYNGSIFKKAVIFSTRAKTAVSSGSFETELTLNVLNSDGDYRSFIFQQDGVLDLLGLQMYPATDVEIGGLTGVVQGQFGYGSDRKAPVFYDGTAFRSVSSFVSVPASKTASGKAGQISADASYIYVCRATDTWVRVAIDNTW